jgi:hypothetical protein
VHPVLACTMTRTIPEKCCSAIRLNGPCHVWFRYYVRELRVAISLFTRFLSAPLRVVGDLQLVVILSVCLSASSLPPIRISAKTKACLIFLGRSQRVSGSPSLLAGNEGLSWSFWTNSISSGVNLRTKALRYRSSSSLSML